MFLFLFFSPLEKKREYEYLLSRCFVIPTNNFVLNVFYIVVFVEYSNVLLGAYFSYDFFFLFKKIENEMKKKKKKKKEE